MMTALLPYAFNRGVNLSRGIASAWRDGLDFLEVTGIERPDLRTISTSRERHFAALS